MHHFWFFLSLWVSPCLLLLSIEHLSNLGIAVHVFKQLPLERWSVGTTIQKVQWLSQAGYDPVTFVLAPVWKRTSSRAWQALPVTQGLILLIAQSRMTASLVQWILSSLMARGGTFARFFYIWYFSWLILTILWNLSVCSQVVTREASASKMPQQAWLDVTRCSSESTLCNYSLLCSSPNCSGAAHQHWIRPSLWPTFSYRSNSDFSLLISGWFDSMLSRSGGLECSGVWTPQYSHWFGQYFNGLSFPRDWRETEEWSPTAASMILGLHDFEWTGNTMECNIICIYITQ